MVLVRLPTSLFLFPSYLSLHLNPSTYIPNNLILISYITTNNKPQTSSSCIRGHRSTKCSHYDRPMKRIPKAGRPLAKCSHLNGVDCHCREVWAVMVPLAPGMFLFFIPDPDPSIYDIKWDRDTYWY